MKIITAARASKSEYVENRVAVLTVLGESAERLSNLLKMPEFRGKTKQEVLVALTECYEEHGKDLVRMPRDVSEKPATPRLEIVDKGDVVILVVETAGRVYSVSEKPEFKGRTENELFLALATCYERYKEEVALSSRNGFDVWIRS